MDGSWEFQRKGRRWRELIRGQIERIGGVSYGCRYWAELCGSRRDELRRSWLSRGLGGFYGGKREGCYGEGDWREQLQQAEDSGQTTFALRSVFRVRREIDEIWRVDLEGAGKVEDAWGFWQA